MLHLTHSWCLAHIHGASHTHAASYTLMLPLTHSCCLAHTHAFNWARTNNHTERHTSGYNNHNSIHQRAAVTSSRQPYEDKLQSPAQDNSMKTSSSHQLKT
eukprot:scpid112418/ scgid3312/ 